MGRTTVKLPTALRQCERVVIDTMALIYFFEDTPRYGVLCEQIVRRIARGDFIGIVTPITVAELLVKPLEQGRTDISDAYRRAISNLQNVELPSMTYETGCLAGALRAKYGFALPDMFQIAVALQTRLPAILTNDKALLRIEEVNVFLLDEML